MFELDRIASAVIIQALNDIAEGDPEAYAWMQSTGLSWLEMLGLEVDRSMLGRILSRNGQKKHFAKKVRE